MKKILNILAMLFVVFTLKAQMIIPVEDFYKFDQPELPENSYIKDVNNVLDKFEGTWKGTYDNKNYEINIVKSTFNNVKLKYKKDRLLLRYKITDINNKILKNTLNIPDTDTDVVKGAKFVESGGYELGYYGDVDCKHGDIYITMKPNATKMFFIFLEWGNSYDCNPQYPKVLMPTEFITLTKQ